MEEITLKCGCIHRGSYCTHHCDESRRLHSAWCAIGHRDAYRGPEYAAAGRDYSMHHRPQPVSNERRSSPEADYRRL